MRIRILLFTLMRIGILLFTTVADPGFLSRIQLFSIPHPNFSIPDPHKKIKKFKYFNPKKWFLSSRKYDPGCSSRFPDPYLLPIPDPGSRGQKGTGSRIRIRNTAFHFMRIRDPAFHSDADPDPAYQNDADPCGSGSVTLNYSDSLWPC
jgi:hypothetical protein